MKMIKKGKNNNRVKIAAAVLCIFGVTIVALSDGISTASESKEQSLLTAFTGGENEALLPESLKVVEEVDFEGKAPLQIKFDSKQFVGPMNSYDWNFGDGEMAKGAIASHTFVSAGTYHVTLTAKASTGMTHQKNILVSVEPKE
ncbi:PKD domain-containing protein [Desulforhopalus sp. 52FAK]